MLLAALSCVPDGAAMAQIQPQSLPGSADPGRLENRFRAPQAPSVDEIAGPSGPNADGPIPFAEEGFVLQGVELQGVTAFPPGAFDPLVSEYTARTVDLATLNHLAARITAAYRHKGYFLSRAVLPTQEIENGNVVIRVIEGRVSNVHVEDPDGLLSRDPMGILSGIIEGIKAMSPLHGPTLERYALLLNQSYGIYVQSILTAPEQVENLEAGSIDIALKVTRNPPEFSLAYNNYGSRFIGPHQATAQWVGGNVLNSYDRLQVQASTSVPVREVQYGAVDYTIPLMSNGLSAHAALSYSNSEPGHTLKPLEVEGDSTFAEIGLTYPLLLTRKTALEIGAAFQLHNTATEFLDEELIDDKLRVLRLAATLQTQDRWDGTNILTAGINKGADVLGATKTGSENLSRGRGHSDFLSFTVDAARQQHLPANFELSADMSAQYTQVPLLSSQEFGYGGPRFGRAYDPSEITGDQGMAGGLELRYDGIDPLLNENLRLVPFAFYDIGKVWNEDPGEKPVSASSAGVGVYYELGGRVSGSLQAAFPLTKSVATPVMNGDDGPRILFSLKTAF